MWTAPVLAHSNPADKHAQVASPSGPIEVRAEALYDSGALADDTNVEDSMIEGGTKLSHR